MNRFPSLLLSGLFLVPMVFAQQPVQGPFVITNFINMKGENEYTVMTMAEYQERYKIVRQEKALFARAMRAADIEWSNSDNTLRFPGRSFRAPEFMRMKVSAREKDAQKDLNKLLAKEEERLAIQQRNEEKKEESRRRSQQRNSRYGGGSKTTGRTTAEFYAVERENKEKAYGILRDKLDELMGVGDTPHALRVEPDEVLGTNRPR